jgi:hypothetical protein
MFCCWDATISVRKTFVFWPKGAQGAGAIESAAGAERRLGKQQAFSKSIGRSLHAAPKLQCSAAIFPASTHIQTIW